MNEMLIRLPKEEQVTLTLYRLFEQRGYLRYRMSSFESYELYLAHKSFLPSEGVITFPDASGRLMALKPDVTMSIVKHTKHSASSEKLYYIESVFRAARGGSEAKEISQMGIEYIGGEGGYAEAEVVLLAQQSLAAICEEYVLDISHMGYVAGLLDTLPLEEAQRAEAMEALRGKNAHRLLELAQQAGCTARQAETLAALARLSGPFGSTLETAGALACTDEMHAAVTALQTLYDTLCAMGAGQNLRLDFSMLNDMDYYNGLLLQGYVRGVPHAVLSGGRYDNLMKRFDKPQAAIGFALYLGELGRVFAQRPEYDVDVLLLYDIQYAPALVARAVDALLAQGLSVRAALAVPENVRARRTLRLCENGETEEPVC